MRLTVQNVFGLLIRSRLLPRDELQKLLERWHGKAGPEADDSAAFLRWLVIEHHLTQFQADLIARCRADSFFLGQYKLLDRISHGWLTGAFKAQHPSGQLVAIRPLLTPAKKDPAARAEFRSTAERSMQWQHANMVRLFHVGKAHGQRYIALEWLDGESLDEVLDRRGRLSPEEAAGVVFHTLQGLQRMHERGAVHGRVTARSVILAREPFEASGNKRSQGVVKLLDADLAHLLADPATTEADARSERIAAGNPMNLAPEPTQSQSKGDIRADILAMGCILYHALTGQPPFRADGENQKPPRPLREFDETIPDGLQQIVNWMMAPDPAQRYPTPERAGQALHVFLAAGSDALSMENETGPSRTYLTWLETTKKARAQPATAHPVDRVDLPIEPWPATMSPHAVKKASKPKRKSGAALQEPANQAPKPESSAPEDAWDVELMPMAAPGRPALALGNICLSRRDLFMLGIGAASAAVAMLIGWWVAHF